MKVHVLEVHQIQRILSELDSDQSAAPYDAFDQAWICLIKLGNLMTGKSEHDRLSALLDQMDEAVAAKLLKESSIDDLINLEPPLDTVLSSPHERLDKDIVSQWIGEVRDERGHATRESLLSLVEILKRIRNKRAHGLKTPDGPRDTEILSASASITAVMVRLAAERLFQIHNQGEIPI
jgi:hypothetical protein